MTPIAVRPRFKKQCQCVTEDVEQRVRDRLQAQDSPCVGHFVEGYAVLKIPAAQRHFWSPQLSVSFEQTAEGTLMRGLYGPDPGLWAFFFYGRAVVGIIAMMVVIAGLSEWWLHDDLTYFALLPVCGAVAFALWAIARSGRKIGEPQTLVLHHFFETTVGTHVELE
ncbi:MAG: hypothetical protein K9J06_00660 [Flavobacteriales bacterium]|nr:hypothetical protein [Flavobacteriales bacterium]